MNVHANKFLIWVYFPQNYGYSINLRHDTGNGINYLLSLTFVITKHRYSVLHWEVYLSVYFQYIISISQIK